MSQQQIDHCSKRENCIHGSTVWNSINKKLLSNNLLNRWMIVYQRKYSKFKNIDSNPFLILSCILFVSFAYITDFKWTQILMDVQVIMDAIG